MTKFLEAGVSVAVVTVGLIALQAWLVLGAAAPMWLLQQAGLDEEYLLARVLYLAAGIAGFVGALWLLAKVTRSRL